MVIWTRYTSKAGDVGIHVDWKSVDKIDMDKAIPLRRVNGAYPVAVPLGKKYRLSSQVAGYDRGNPELLRMFELNWEGSRELKPRRNVRSAPCVAQSL